MAHFRVTVCEGSGVRAEEYANWPMMHYFKPGYRLCAFCARIVKNRKDTQTLAHHKRLHHERVLAWEKYHFGKTPYAELSSPKSD